MEIITPLPSNEPRKFEVVIGDEQAKALIYAVSSSIVLDGLTVAGFDSLNVSAQFRRNEDGTIRVLLKADYTNLPDGWTPVVPPQDPAPTSEIDPPNEP